MCVEWELAQTFRDSFHEQIWGINACGWIYCKKTTFKRCWVTPHDFRKFKRSARTLRRSTHVVFTPPQRSWLPNPTAMLRCFVRKTSLLLCRLQLRCSEKLYSNQMPPTLRSCELSVLKKVSLSPEQGTSPHRSLWGKQWRWRRFCLCSEV
jgi:hypothetical protein